MDGAALADEGVGPGMLRLSVGLENVEDLWRDRDVALQASVPAEKMVGAQ